MPTILSSILAAAVAVPLICACDTSTQGNLASNGDFNGTSVEKGLFDLEIRQACGSGAVTNSGAEVFARKPYLQKTTSSSVEVLWTTRSSDAGLIRVTEPDGTVVAEISPVDDPTVARSFDQYVASLEGLESEHIYCYEILGEDGVWLQEAGFRTAPGDVPDAPVRIVALGDLGSRTSDQYAVLDQLKNVPFDLAVVTGDLAYDTGTLSDHENNFFDVYKDVLRALPFFVISGNHDYASDGAVFREVFSLPDTMVSLEDKERWYSFDWGNIHFVAIDTQKIGAE